jgi:hypothetical protein
LAATSSINADATNSGVEEAAETSRASIASVAAKTRPKALEHAAALSMVAVAINRATTNTTDAAKGEVQITNNMGW